MNVGLQVFVMKEVEKFKELCVELLPLESIESNSVVDKDFSLAQLCESRVVPSPQMGTFRFSNRLRACSNETVCFSGFGWSMSL